MGKRRKGGSWNPMIEERFLAFWAHEPRLVMRSVARQQDKQDGETYNDYGDCDGEEVQF